MIDQHEFSIEVQAATEIAVIAGEKILSGEFSSAAATNECEEKDDLNVGHHAVVTPHDIGSQNFILRFLSHLFPSAYFVTEEKGDACKEKIISDEMLHKLLMHELIFNVDPLDGTTSRNNGLYEWSVSIGVMRGSLCHTGGAIYAPDVRGGMLVYGERERGVFLEEHGKKAVTAKIGQSARKGSVIYIGPDIFFMLDKYGSFLNAASKEVRTTNCNGSCALSFAGIASGKIDALIQPVQSPWDWAAGFPLVEEAGGKMLFYDYSSGRPERVMPSAASYSPTRRNIAFIAGNPECVDWLWALLQESWSK